jgi:hypothetical protein
MGAVAVGRHRDSLDQETDRGEEKNDPEELCDEHPHTNRCSDHARVRRHTSRITIVAPIMSRMTSARDPVRPGLRL